MVAGIAPVPTADPGQRNGCSRLALDASATGRSVARAQRAPPQRLERRRSRPASGVRRPLAHRRPPRLPFAPPGGIEQAWRTTGAASRSSPPTRSTTPTRAPTSRASSARLTDALAAEQPAVTLIRVPPHSDFEQGTGHFHAELEELYLVARGTLTMRPATRSTTGQRAGRRARRARDAALAPQRGRRAGRDVGGLAQDRTHGTRRRSTTSGRRRRTPPSTAAADRCDQAARASLGYDPPRSRFMPRRRGCGTATASMSGPFVPGPGRPRRRRAVARGGLGSLDSHDSVCRPLASEVARLVSAPTRLHPAGNGRGGCLRWDGLFEPAHVLLL